MKIRNTAALVIVALLSLATFTSCEKINVPEGTPYCITKKIRRMKADPVTNPPRSVWRYSYQGQTVYYIPPMCCDIPSQLFDSDCNFICNPDGGIAGGGDGRCSDFFTTRTGEQLIWQDDRK